MSDAITIKCPACKASLKLKNRNSVGKKVPCPKCKKPFVVKAPPEDDDLAFLDASESDGSLPMSEDEEDEFAAAPTARASKAPGGKKAKKGKARSSSGVNWVKPLLIGVAALVVVGLMVGGGIVAYSLIGGQAQNKIDLTYLPPDADLVVHVRVDDLLGSPFVQPLMANATVKKQLDQLANEYHVAPGDVKTITMGVAGTSELKLSNMNVPGMGMPGTARPGTGPGFEKTRGVAVFRMTRPLDAEKMTKIPGYVSAEHQGKTYYRPAVMDPNAPKPVVYLAAPDVLLVADEPELHRIIDKGSKQTRRAEFDFVDTTPQILIAGISKNTPSTGTSSPPSAPTAPPGMPGGMPGMPGQTPGSGMNELPSLTNGKVKAWYIGISGTQDIEIQVGLHSPGALPEVQGELEKFAAKMKTDFQAAKNNQLAMLSMMGMGDLIAQLEATVNSLQVSGSGSTAQVRAKMPGAIKSSIEKGIGMMAGMMGSGPGGLGGPNPFGAQPDGAGAEINETPSDETPGETTGTSPGDSSTQPQ